MHIKIIGDRAERYTLRQLRKENPNTSFPKVPSDETLAALGVFHVTQADKPVTNQLQVAERDAQPTDQGDGTYVWGWTVKDKSVAQLSEEARDKRNALLTASDYTQLADSPRDKQTWATYRQALRDITDQGGFPETIVWPVEP